METPYEFILNLDLIKRTRRALSTLTPREEKVIRMLFGIGESQPYTPTEVAVYFGIPTQRDRIRQIRDKALRKLRHPSRARLIREFAE